MTRDNRQALSISLFVAPDGGNGKRQHSIAAFHAQFVASAHPLPATDPALPRILLATSLSLLGLSLLGPSLSGLVGSAAAAETKPEQLVIVSFDGAHNNALWDKSLALGERTGARFTYFLSCTFLMKWGSPQAAAYKPPHHRAGSSATGFAQTDEEIRIRLHHIWNAHLNNHEIASHACGHFDGGGWSEADWAQEFESFTHTLSNAWTTAGIAAAKPLGWDRFVAHGITGFRAPYLSHGNALPNAVRKAGFRYDASLITKGPALPVDERGLTRFGLPLIPEGPAQKPVIAMDYNLYARHSRTREDAARSAEFEARSLAAYRAAFEGEFNGERRPLQLGFHFVEMNAGAYWRALDTFLTETCQRPGVACVSYAEALDRLKARQAVEKAEAEKTKGGPLPPSRL